MALNLCGMSDLEALPILTKSVRHFDSAGRLNRSAKLGTLIDEDLKAFDLSKVDQELCIKVSKCLQAGPTSASILNGFEFLESKLGDENAFHANTMSGILKAHETTVGININADGELMTTGINRMLTAEEFGEHLKDRTLFKDPGVSANHGDNTHRIQWLILTKFNVISIQETEILFDALIRNLTSKYEKKPLSGLWDCLFDRLGVLGPGPFKCDNDTDFRGPEKLNLWLIKGEHEFPLLKLILSGKHDTRNKQRGSLAMEYLQAMAAEEDKVLINKLLEISEDIEMEPMDTLFPIIYEATKEAFDKPSIKAYKGTFDLDSIRKAR